MLLNKSGVECIWGVSTGHRKNNFLIKLFCCEILPLHMSHSNYQEGSGSPSALKSGPPEYEATMPNTAVAWCPDDVCVQIYPDGDQIPLIDDLNRFIFSLFFKLVLYIWGNSHKYGKTPKSQNSDFFLLWLKNPVSASGFRMAPKCYGFFPEP